MQSGNRVLLKNGFIVDGTGKKGKNGDLLIEGGKIERISETPLQVDCEVIDCTGQVIAPGFIDMHSHMDWIVPTSGRDDLKSPFTDQGITTFIAGNCGHSPFGLKEDSQFKEFIQLTGKLPFEMNWNTVSGYFDNLGEVGLNHNLATFVGHGTTRTSIRGFDPSPLSPQEMKEMLYLLEESMDQGAVGVSFGLGYEPGIFASNDEIAEIARLVKSKDKLISVHARAYSSFSNFYPIEEDGLPHNVLSINEMLSIAGETGVRLQYSHLMFAGSHSHTTYAQCLEVLDQAAQEGIDVMTDTYAYHCGNSIINVFISPWFLEDVPNNYHNPEALSRLEGELDFVSQALGFGYDNIQISNATHPELNKYNGMFLSEIAEELGVSPFQVTMDFSEKTGGRASVLNHNYSNMEVMDALIRYPRCLFMTDTVVNPEGGIQNPASFGNFPRLLQFARDRKLVSLEEVVRKMTGASAERFKIKDRGVLQEGLAADITVFNWDTVKDNNTVKETDKSPTGIEAVFVNGRQVKKSSQVKADIHSGSVLPV